MYDRLLVVDGRQDSAFGASGGAAAVVGLTTVCEMTGSGWILVTLPGGILVGGANTNYTINLLGWVGVYTVVTV